MGKTSGLIEASALHMLHDGETYMRAGVREGRACGKCVRACMRVSVQIQKHWELGVEPLGECKGPFRSA